MTETDKLTALIQAEALIDYSKKVKEEKKTQMKMLIRSTTRKFIERLGPTEAGIARSRSASNLLNEDHRS